MYIAVRRRIRPLTVIVALGVVWSILCIVLAALSEGNTVYQAVFAGIIVGGLFSGGTLALAWYFHNSEQRAALASSPPDNDVSA
jgi:uncharacterized membrane protein